MGVYKLSNKAEIDLASMYEFGISKFGLHQSQKYFLGMHETNEIFIIRVLDQRMDYQSNLSKE